MVRTNAFVASGALALAAVLIGPATAKAAVTGSVTCELKGSAVISPGLTVTPSGNAKKKIKTKTTFNGTLTNCSGTQTGTKKGAQIDGGTVTATGKTTTNVGDALPSCTGLTAPTAPTVLKATVKFTAAGKKIATSKVNLTVGAATIDQNGKVSFPASGPVSGGNAFKGQTLTADALLDKTALDLANLCTGGTTTTFSFTGSQGGSTLDVAP
jgi:hypothetical protein